MSEGPIPKEWKEAVPNVIWVVLVLGFGLELVAALVRAEWARSAVSFLGLVGLMALVIHWDRIRALAKVSDAKFIVSLMVVALIALPLSGYFKTELEGAVSWGLIVLAAISAATAALLSFRHLRPLAEEKPSPAPTAAGVDGQTHLDLLHLLDFALLQSVFWELDRLLEVAQSPAVTDGIAKGDEDAHNARRWFIGYTQQHLGARTWRQNDFINAMAFAESEAERELEATAPEERPSGIDHLTLRKYRISETQFRRAILFLEHQRRELKEKLGGGRHILAERSRERSTRK